LERNTVSTQVRGQIDDVFSIDAYPAELSGLSSQAP